MNIVIKRDQHTPRPNNTTRREVHVDGQRVGIVQRWHYGRFGNGPWILVLAIPGRKPTLSQVSRTEWASLASVRDYVARAVREHRSAAINDAKEAK